MRAIAPDVAAIASFSQTDHILADLYDLTAKTVTWRVAPKPYPRPADQIRQKSRSKSRGDALERQNERIRQRQIEAEGG